MRLAFGGREERNRYLETIDTLFNWLADNPEVGRKRYDIAPGYRCFAQGQDLIFYIVREGGALPLAPGIICIVNNLR
jgi:toxin ParE1/3/4